MAAFALGLIGDRARWPRWSRRLVTRRPSCREALPKRSVLSATSSAADAVGRLASQIVQSGALAELPGDDADARRDLPATAFRQAIYALVRLKAYDQLAAAVLDASGQPKVRWWPVAYAFQRIEDKRALPALLTLANESHPYTRAFAAKGLGGLKDASAVPALIGLLGSSDGPVVIESVRALGRIGDAAAAPALVKLMQAKETRSRMFGWKWWRRWAASALPASPIWCSTP